MYRTMKKLLTILSLFVCLSVSAQEGGFRVTAESYDDDKVEMADEMRSNGKIYVVVSVVMIIFIGLIGYTVTIDRKLRKLEDEVFKEKANS
jgi:CcmD family protein